MSQQITYNSSSSDGHVKNSANAISVVHSGINNGSTTDMFGSTSELNSGTDLQKNQISIKEQNTATIQNAVELTESFIDTNQTKTVRNNTNSSQNSSTGMHEVSLNKSYSKDSSKIKKINNTGDNWNIGITICPEYCYRVLKASGDTTDQWIAEKRDSFEIPRFGYTVGIGIAYKMSDRFTLESGILYSDQGEQIKDALIMSNMPGIIAYPGIVKKYSLIYHYLYLDVPFKTKYYILNKRAKFFVSAGLSSNFFITQKIRSITEYINGDKNSNISYTQMSIARINLAINAGFGFRYDLSEKTYFKLEPNYKRSLTSISKAASTGIKGFLYSTGMDMGVYYKL